MTSSKEIPIRIAQRLRRELKPLKFASPVSYVYNPLDYAWRSHSEYLRRYGLGRKEVVLFGMNPGPWGMAQTGIPFGEVAIVRDWLGIEAKVDKPEFEHPKRPIEGFECQRTEVSGARLWGFIRNVFKTPKRFFERCFVANYCPLVFMEDTGRNRTPDKLPINERVPLQSACNYALRDLVAYYQPNWVIGVGQFAEKRAKETLADFDVKIGRILHPSPASPIANRGWAKEAAKQIAELGLKF
ncbi:MAG: single-stranded DNA-binding protein [Rhodospirillaceae bacterium]|nr:single-stranded DNA-binding protein [Rhodospirillaceae bacterium]